MVVEKTHGAAMSSDLRTTSSTIYLNATETESRNAFDIFLLAACVCVLSVTAAACCASCVKRRRREKAACEYESAVACDLKEDLQVNLKGVQRSQSFQSPVRQGSLAKDSIYYIYTNPLPVMDDDDALTHTTGIILDPLTHFSL